MRTSETVKEIADALAKAQAVMEPASKDSENPHFKSKYADLSAVWDSIREPLTLNGISVLQDVENHGQGVSVTTRLQHVSGEWFEFGPLVVPMQKDDAHGVGSACTYGRRFALSAAVGVVADVDDDGNAAVDKEGKATRKGTDAAPRGPVPAPAPEPPSYEVVTDEEVTQIHAAAKRVGIASTGALKPVLIRLCGVDSAKLIPKDRFDHVMEQIALVAVAS